MSDPLKMPPVLAPIEYYQLFRNRIEHEDELVVQRLSWLVASQSFLFTAYAIALNGLNSLPAATVGVLVSQERLLLWLIPVVGILTCGLIYLGILAAARAIHELRLMYHSRFDEADAPLPDLMPKRPIRRLGLTAPLLLPLMFVIVWLVLWTRMIPA